MNLPKSIIITLIAIFFILNIGLVFGLDPNEASVEVIWDRITFYQGDTAIARIVFTNNFSQPVELHYVGINFDWFSPDKFQGLDLSSSPVIVPSYSFHQFEPMVFQIPIDAIIGDHEYFVGVDGSYGGGDGYLPIGFSWDSPVFTLQIQNVAQKSYFEKNAQVSIKINNASELTYDSPEANNLVYQALTAYNNATDYALNGQFQEAIASLEIASNYVDLANQEEKTFDQQQQDQSYTLMMILIIGVIITLGIILVFMVFPKKKKTLKKSPKKKKTLKKSPKKKKTLKKSPKKKKTSKKPDQKTPETET
jgi:hypothetical protein